MRRILLALLLLVSAGTASPAGEQSRLVAVTVSDLHVLAGEEIGGQRPTELSGLAWDADKSLLYAVSDRGRLFTFALEIERGRLASVVPLAGALISDGRKPNAEALLWRRRVTRAGGGGELVLADESAINALVIDTQGRSTGIEPLPEPLRAKERWHNASSGVESLAWHSWHGLLAVPQRPLRGDLPGVHRVYASSGQVWAFLAHPAGRSSIKAIELIDAQRLLVLEKVKLSDGHLTVLRELSLDGCTPAAPCNAPTALLKDARLQPDDNFEGLACIDIDLCLLVTDSGGASSGRTVLAMVLLSR